MFGPHWVKSEAISIIMQVFQNNTFGVVIFYLFLANAKQLIFCMVIYVCTLKQLFLVETQISQ